MGQGMSYCLEAGPAPWRPLGNEVRDVLSPELPGRLPRGCGESAGADRSLFRVSPQLFTENSFYKQCVRAQSLSPV